MKLTSRQSVIVSLLRTFSTEKPLHVGTIQAHTGAPAASIRRNIAALRNKGFNIDATGKGYTLVSELVDLPSGPAVAVNQGPQSEADDLRDEYSAPEYHDDDADDDPVYDPFDDYDNDGWGDDDYGDDDLAD